MATGILTNCLAVLMGGISGSLMKHRISNQLKENLPIVLGISSIVIGIHNLRKISDITVVILSIVIGYICGELLRIDAIIEKMTRFISGIANQRSDNEIMSMALVIFCFSGTGIFGAITEGILGDASILVSKAILDFFTACIFASIAGVSIAYISVLQAMVLYVLFFVSSHFSFLMTPPILGNFLAVGGIITMVIGGKVSGLIKVNPVNFLPGLLLCILLSMF